MHGFRGSNGSFGKNEPPIELRFVDLFMILVTTLIFISVMLSIITSFISHTVEQSSPQIRTTQVPEAISGIYYHLSLSATGGQGEYKWGIVSGALPPGLKLSENGNIYGIPITSLKSSLFLVEVKDSKGAADTSKFNISVVSISNKQDFKIQTINVYSPVVKLPDAISEKKYNYQLKATGGVSSQYTWELIEGSMPPGINPPTRNGVIAGTPAKLNEIYNFKVKVSDNIGNTITQNCRLIVKPAPSPLWKDIIEVIWDIIWYGFFFITILLILVNVLWGSPGSAPTEGLLAKWGIGKRKRKYRY